MPSDFFGASIIRSRFPSPLESIHDTGSRATPNRLRDVSRGLGSWAPGSIFAALPVALRVRASSPDPGLMIHGASLAGAEGDHPFVAPSNVVTGPSATERRSIRTPGRERPRRSCDAASSRGSVNPRKGRSGGRLPADRWSTVSSGRSPPASERPGTRDQSAASRCPRADGSTSGGPQWACARQSARRANTRPAAVGQGDPGRLPSRIILGGIIGDDAPHTNASS